MTETKSGTRRSFAPQQKAAILAEITAENTISAVALKHGINRNMLYVWQRRAAEAAEQAARTAKAKATRKANGAGKTNGHAPLPPPATTPPKLELVGIQAFLRESVRTELAAILPSIVRTELDKLYRKGVG